MSNSSIKITRKNVYTIDLTDDDDNVFHTLSFHLGDANFPVKIMELYDNASKEIERLKEKEEL